MHNVHNMTNAVAMRARKLNRRTLTLVVLVIGLSAALGFGWDRLAAAGLTSFVLGLLPCIVMCGAGLCASRFGGKQGCHGGLHGASDESARPGKENS